MGIANSLPSDTNIESETKTKMPNIKLYYGPMPFWRAEISRLALHLGKVPIENVTSMNLQALRESGKATLGQMPILEVDGKTCVQTGAIARYCGKLSGLYPKTTTGPRPRLTRSSTLPLISRFMWERPSAWRPQQRQPPGLSWLPQRCQST